MWYVVVKVSRESTRERVTQSTTKSDKSAAFFARTFDRCAESVAGDRACFNQHDTVGKMSDFTKAKRKVAMKELRWLNPHKCSSWEPGVNFASCEESIFAVVFVNWPIRNSLAQNLFLTK